MPTCICPKCGANLEILPSDHDHIFCEHCGTKVNINVNYNFNYSKSEHTQHIVDEAKIKAAENVDRVINIFASPFEEYQRKKAEEKREEEEAARKQEEAIRQAQEKARIRHERFMNWLKRSTHKLFALFKNHPRESLLALALCGALFFGGITSWVNNKNRRQELAAHSAELARLKEERIANSHLAIGEVKMPDISAYGDYRNVVKQLKDAGFTNVEAIGKGDLFLGILDTENDIIEIRVSPKFCVKSRQL